MTAPLLVFGWGNASRGDDALGPRFVDTLRAEFEGDVGVEFLDDYQLQIEHALDLVGRRRVLFVDASLSADPPFTVSAIQARAESGFSTHALSAPALLKVYEDLHRTPAPPCTLLAIRGEQFDLGQPLGSAAEAHLAAALAWARRWSSR
ncbi:MAG: hydrogenase maturation protease [Rhodoferax sp.]|nr:hydrogenase maturation protease [Rhodoferax sp.]